MDVLGSILRGPLLALTTSDRAKALAVRVPATAAVVSRFVAGESVEDCLRVVRVLANDGLAVTIDHLGEDTTSTAAAEAVRDAYLRLLSELQRGGLTGQAEVSVKLTALGLALPDGVRIALENARAICAAAEAAGTTVTIDAEDHTRTDATLGILAELRKDYPATAAVLQAYLHRTLQDAAVLASSGARVRLCKGAYAEPESVAHQTREEVSAAYLACARELFDGDGLPLLATHDPQLIAAVPGLAQSSGRSRGDYEFQMLYGIRTDEQRRLAASGESVRVYVPYGSDWWGYFLRRLAERPANLAFFARALVGR